MPDVDIDTQGNRRTRITKALKKFFGEMQVVNVCTFGTEKSKSAIQTACRGLGIDVDIASYLSSMVPSERGFLWSLHDCFYGNEEEGRKPIANFVKEMSGPYAEVWNVAQNIEGLISRRGIHAAGVVISNEEITKTNALMKAPKGQFTTQYELNDTEYMGGLKFDLLSVEALDKIRAELELLCEYGYIERCKNLKDTYMSILDPEDKNILQYDNSEIWKMAYEDKILSLFQMETPVGGAAIKEVKPMNIIELAGINSLMRLMAAGATEMPMQTYNRYKNDIDTWYTDMAMFGLNDYEMDIMRKHLLSHYGVAESQESMMLLVMDEDISNFSVAEADKLRKAVAKKSMKDFDKMQELFYKKGKENGASDRLLEYVWEIQIKRQKGYSFSQLHTYGYSIIALQEMNLAYRFPVIFWNTANLIVDSAGEEEEEDDDIVSVSETDDNDVDEDDGDDELGDEHDDGLSETPVKKKNKTVNYGKISTAIGKMQQRGVSVGLPNVNKSKYTFTPDVERETIMYGIKGITRIGDDLVKTIIENRPYASLHDFLKKVKVNKLQAVNLVKSGAFDELEKLDRKDIMYKYLLTVVDAKKDCNLRNMQMLINQNLIPLEYDFYRKLFNFNKYLKKFKAGTDYELDSDAFRFFSENYNVDLLQQKNGKMVIAQTVWDKIYTKGMDPMRDFLKAHKQEMLDRMNGNLVKEIQDKYAQGNLSKWEMDSLGFYYNEHELSGVNTVPYDIRDFFSEPEEPVVASVFYPKGQSNPVPIFETYRIMGTVIQKDKTKHLVTLLTPTGVVNVKVWQAQFTKYDKQISQKQADGKKKILEKSWFSRGNKLLITGFRRGDNFVPKIYPRGKYEHPFELITDVKDGELITINSRSDAE